MQSLPFLTFFVASSLATKLLLPLYQYPSGTAYDSVYATIEAHPQLDFQVILNVDSGPGGPQPDSAFATAAAKLSAYLNVVVLGYVHCGYGAAAASQVAQNTTNWAAWNSYAGAKVSIDGIFFDETPNSEGAAGAGDVSFVRPHVEAARSAFGTHPFTSMLNPGSAVEHPEYWDLADYVVIFESDASAYSDAVLTTNIPAGRAGQSSILIPGFASVGSEAQAEAWLQAMVQAGVGSAHILNYGYIEAASAVAPAPIGSVAKVLAVGGGVAPAGSASASGTAPQVSSPTTKAPAGASTSPEAASVDAPASTEPPAAVPPTSFVTSYTTKSPSAAAIAPSKPTPSYTTIVITSTTTYMYAYTPTTSVTVIPTPASSSSGQDPADPTEPADGVWPTWGWRHHKHNWNRVHADHA